MSTAQTSRAVGATEHGWCRAIPGGTGITLLSLLLSKPPDLRVLQTALTNLQRSHPILRSKLRLDPSAQSLSFVVPKSPALAVKFFDLASTREILLRRRNNASLPAFQNILVHEINVNPWEKILRDVLGLMKRGGGAEAEIVRKTDIRMGIEEYIPSGKGNKPFWARGVDLLGYSFNSLRLANIDFVDPDSPRRSQLVRLRLEPEEMARLLEGYV